MIPGFDQALTSKYDSLSRNADANMISARGQANLANANAGQVAANADSQRQLQKAQGGYYGAQGNLANANAGEVHGLAQSQIGLQGAQTYKTNEEGAQVAPLATSHIGLEGHQGTYYDNVGSAALINANANSSLADAQVRGLDSDLKGFHAGTADLRPLTDQELHMIHQHLCMGGTIHAMGGMSQVPGQQTPAAQVGTQASDKVPAMLAPDEAVLNKHAADIIGRDKIAAANAIGNHMATQERQNAPTAQNAPQGKPPAGKSAPGKGMIPPKGKAGPGAPKHFAEGTTDAQPNRRAAGDGYMTRGSWLPYNYANPPSANPGTIANSRQLEQDLGPNVHSRASDYTPPKPQNFAGGTHQVAHGKSAKTPTKIDPAAAMALLQMAKGGGGMPAPQPGGGMPMPMPNGSPPQGNPMPMQPAV